MHWLMLHLPQLLVRSALCSPVILTLMACPMFYRLAVNRLIPLGTFLLRALSQGAVALNSIGVPDRAVNQTAAFDLPELSSKIVLARRLQLPVAANQPPRHGSSCSLSNQPEVGALLHLSQPLDPDPVLFKQVLHPSRCQRPLIHLGGRHSQRLVLQGRHSMQARRQELLKTLEVVHRHIVCASPSKQPQ